VLGCGVRVRTRVSVRVRFSLGFRDKVSFRVRELRVMVPGTNRQPSGAVMVATDRIATSA